MNKNVHIIAEAGTNHNGDINKAKNLADIAKRSGADSVKYQIIYPEGLYLPGDYEYGHYDIKEVIQIRKDGILSDEEYDELAHHCKNQGIQFTASVFDEKGLDLLMRFDPPYIKTASCDLNNVRFLKQVAERGRKMIISTGMSSLSDIEFSLNELAKMNFTDIVLLHCVSVYPASLELTNLNFLETLNSSFGFEIGFSDHTGDSIAAAMALAKGASWFEKHFTEDKKQHGFDHAYAMEEHEFKKYVNDLRMAEKALQMKKEKLSDDEMYTRERARRSLYASKDLAKGVIVQNDDVLIVRPEGPMNADEIGSLIGSKLKKPLKKYKPFTKDHI